MLLDFCQQNDTELNVLTILPVSVGVLLFGEHQDFLKDVAEQLPLKRHRL